jgi:hypothetical protein
MQRLKRTCAMLLGTAMISLIFSLAGGVSTASAHNDNCSYTGVWHCSWIDFTQAPGAMHWFYAANTLRYWTQGNITGESGYLVTDKCVHITTNAGPAYQVACGWGSQTGPVYSAWRPGYLWTRHGADGPRHITGNGWH